MSLPPEIFSNHVMASKPRLPPIRPNVIKPTRTLSRDLVPWSQLSNFAHTEISRLPIAVPQNEAVQATYESNSKISSLLRLPADIRYEIWRALLGDRLIHIRHRNLASPDTKHVVCQCDEMNGYYPDQEALLSHTYMLDEWEPPHDACRYDTYYNPDPSSPDYEESKRMPLRVLRSCRQIYFEANHVLWTTNTFSFHDSISLGYFLERRTPNQLSMMQKLRLRFDFLHDCVVERRRALTSDQIDLMSNVRSLRLIIQEVITDRLLELQKMTGSSLTQLGGNRVETDLFGLRRLNLKSLEVHVIPPLPNSYILGPGSSREEILQTLAAKEWRTEYENLIRAYLMGS